MTILEHVKRAIREGFIPAELVIHDGEAGVLFLDENEFIPFADLNYSRELGYFRISLFPDEPRECENTPVTGSNLNAGARGRRWARGADHRVVGYIQPAWADELLRLGRNQADAVRTAIDVALHPFEPQTAVISLASPHPCGIRSGDGVCGQPAQVAYAYPWRHPVYPGHWVILPVCRDCAERAARTYG